MGSSPNGDPICPERAPSRVTIRPPRSAMHVASLVMFLLCDLAPPVSIGSTPAKQGVTPDRIRRRFAALFMTIGFTCACTTR